MSSPEPGEGVVLFVSATDGVYLYVGAAFVAAIDDELWLLTAAHVPTGAQPTNEWHKWPDVLTLHTSSGALNVDLFDGSEGERRPRFGYYAHPDGGLNDAMWIRLRDLGSTAQMVLDDVRVFELRTELNVQPGMPVSAHGYPNAGPGNYPPREERVDGLLLGFRAGPIIVAHLATVPGYSGGPALDSAQELYGLVIGTHPGPEDPAQIVPAPTLVTMIRGPQGDGSL